MSSQMTFEQEIRADFQRRMLDVSNRAKRLSENIVKEARETARKAGLSPEMPFLHAHNALCGKEYGKPWPEVNYSLARKVLWLEKKSWEPREIADRIYRREWNRMIDATRGMEPRYTDGVADENETI